MSSIVPTLALAGLALSGPAHAADLSIPHERFQLENGLDVVLAPDPSTPIVHVQVWYYVGSKDETKGLTGFAHLFEHLMFQGSKNVGGEYFAPIQQVGGTLNGTTNVDRTNYYETVPAHQLPLALFLESDRMGALLDVLDQTKLDNQRMVVRNERRQRYENPPYGEAWVTLSAHLWPEGHPYHHTTIGSHEDLERASLDDVKAFFRTWYVPNNASLVVTGDFDPAVAKALITEQFGWIPKGAEPQHATAAPVVIPAIDKIVEYDEVPDRKVWMAWTSPALFDAGDAELDLASTLLCDEADGRLAQRLVKDLRIARDVACYQQSRSLGSAFVVQATASTGHTTDEVVAEVQAVLAAVPTTPPSATQVSAAVTAYTTGFYRGLETIDSRGGVLSTYLARTGNPDGAAADLARYEGATAEGVVAELARVTSAPHVELHILPKADQEAK